MPQAPIARFRILGMPRPPSVSQDTNKIHLPPPNHEKNTLGPSNSFLYSMRAISWPGRLISPPKKLFVSIDTVKPSDYALLRAVLCTCGRRRQNHTVYFQECVALMSAQEVGEALELLFHSSGSILEVPIRHSALDRATNPRIGNYLWMIALVTSCAGKVQVDF